MSPKPDDPQPRKTRRTLLVFAWALLAASLLLCLAGPRLSESGMPPEIGNRIGYLDWSGLGWIIVGMIVGALALMCFVAQWVLRRGEEGSPASRKN